MKDDSLPRARMRRRGRIVGRGRKRRSEEEEERKGEYSIR